MEKNVALVVYLEGGKGVKFKVQARYEIVGCAWRVDVPALKFSTSALPEDLPYGDEEIESIKDLEMQLPVIISKELESRIKRDIPIPIGNSADSKIAKFLATSHVSIPAKTLALRTLGIDAKAHFDPEYPNDPDELQDCVLLMRKVPEARTALQDMSDQPGWKRLIPAWRELEDQLVEEMGASLSSRAFSLDGRCNAPQTWDLIERTLEAPKRELALER